MEACPERQIGHHDRRCTTCRQAIKYLVKDGRYDYIETGSLISIKKNTKGITIPSEEERVTLYPMDYEEFRWALGDEVTVPLLRTFIITPRVYDPIPIIIAPN